MIYIYSYDEIYVSLNCVKTRFEMCSEMLQIILTNKQCGGCVTYHFLHSTMNTFSRRSLGSQCESQKMSTLQAVSESRKMSTILSDDDDDGDSHGDDDDDDDDDGCRNNFQVGNC